MESSLVKIWPVKSLSGEKIFPAPRYVLHNLVLPVENAEQLKFLGDSLTLSPMGLTQ